ncbi:expressed unknown protein [Seminavis robusta]|uniref:START domain-containing protein n=1 Tax=Seminavis robusta TaxID=568900 RepID=A0A9N8H7M2_9STRA|nr:expressed unknown protein [Seminavis robusta]|eukprot:Sro208_g087200.1 n/a (331) ;mRNA; r:83936-84998
MMVQAAMPTRIRSLDLLDEAAMEDCVVLWVAIRSPVGLVNDRDFCLVFHFRKTQCPLTGNVIALTNFFSIMHPSVPDMERALDRVRGEIIMGGYIMRPKPDDDSQFCLQYMIQYNDPKGALPNAVVNAVILSQGLNAGRFREYTWKMTKMAWDLTKGRIPIGCYDVRRGAKTEHRLQLRVSGDQFPVNANTLRTFKFQVAVHASFTVLMKLSTNDANGVPLPVTIRRSDQSDAMAKVFAGGNTVAFGWNGFHMFHATLLMAVEGPLPEFLTLRFRNTLWRQNHVYVPAITELTQVTTPEPSLSGNSMVSSGRGKSPKFRRALTPSDRSTD